MWHDSILVSKVRSLQRSQGDSLCHARASTTVNIYAHAMPGADRDAAKLLANLLTPP